MKILVIDGEYLARYTLARILRSNGHEVVTAVDGERGMAVFRSAAPDVVITGSIMPGHDGRATIRQMRGERPDAKIIAISGGDEIGDADLPAIAGRLGADDAICRPFDATDLLSRVRQLHALPEPGDGVAE